MTPNGESTVMVDFNTLALPELYQRLAATGLVRRLLELARDEDLGPTDSPWRGKPAAAGSSTVLGDITTAACIQPDQMGEASLVAREAGVIAGLECVPELLSLFAPGTTFEPAAGDGQSVPASTLLGTLRGPLDEILELERTLLNLVSRLCGVATTTRTYLDAMNKGAPTKARLLDTRKTTPGLRVLEKYAVRCGGGFSHRMGLYDAVLIKDNHIAAVPLSELASFVAGAASIARAQASRPPDFVEVEVDSLDQFKALLTLPPGTIDIVLLDNMGPVQLREAVSLRDLRNPQLLLESSGGVDLSTIRAIAQTGVDRISVGALTHSAVSMDLALDVVPHA